jgi:hypothetical protein
MRLTKGFLFLYVVYIFVVLVGRYINQRMKFRDMGETAVRKNDFSSNSTRTNATVVAVRAVNAEADEYENEADYENENLTRPLLTKTHTEELPEVSFSGSDALKNTFIPIDFDEWRTSNIIFKFMILVKVLKTNTNKNIYVFYHRAETFKRY